MNWSRSSRATPTRVERPATVSEVVDVMARARRDELTVRPSGGRFSANGLAATRGVSVDMTALRGLLHLDPEAGTATFGAGTRLGEAMAALEDHGFALANPTRNIDVTLGGIASTGGHGWGMGFGSISSQLVGLRLVTPTGEVLRISEHQNAEFWRAARLNLGALGIVTDLTFAIVPAYRARVIEKMESFVSFTEDAAWALRSADHVAAQWLPHTGRLSVQRGYREHRAPSGSYRLSRVRASGQDFRETVKIAAAKVLPGVVPPLNRLANMFHVPEHRDGSAAALSVRPRVPSLILEYALPIERTGEALALLDRRIAAQKLVVPSEVLVTASAADDACLSTNYGRTCGHIMIRMPRQLDPRPYFAAAEELFLALGGLPHWAGAHTVRAAEFAYVLPRWNEFLEVRHTLDPEHRMMNGHLRRVLGE